jgi:hypothetical protein
MRDGAATYAKPTMGARFLGTMEMRVPSGLTLVAQARHRNVQAREWTSMGLGPDFRHWNRECACPYA